jgi:hypothetical protein
VVVDEGEGSFHSYSIHPLNHMHSVELTCCSRLFPSFICELVHEVWLGAERNWASLWLLKSSWRRQGWCWGVRTQLRSSTTACFSAPPALLLISSTRFGFKFQEQDSSTGYFRSASEKMGGRSRGHLSELYLDIDFGTEAHLLNFELLPLQW